MWLMNKRLIEVQPQKDWKCVSGLLLGYGVERGGDTPNEQYTSQVSTKRLLMTVDLLPKTMNFTVSHFSILFIIVNK